MRDDIGDRMKNCYENRSKQFLTRRTNTIIRIDGKAFHTYTSNCAKPFDWDLMADMADATKVLCQEIQGAKLGYTQSDEISIFLTDYDTLTTNAWFDNSLQKICSVAASIATFAFNSKRRDRGILAPAYFDARVFQIPEKAEVANYFLWRCQDAARNSIQMLCQSLFSPAQLHGKKVPDMHEMLYTKGYNWNDLAPNKKRGSLIRNVQHCLDTASGYSVGLWLDEAIPDTHGFAYWFDLINKVTDFEQKS
jgi:tRNA(His) guanylyltransferase